VEVRMNLLGCDLCGFECHRVLGLV
jgi:hypothetical protein